MGCSLKHGFSPGRREKGTSVIATHRPDVRHETLKLRSLRGDRPVDVRSVAQPRGKRLDSPDKPVVLLQDVERVRPRSNSTPQPSHSTGLRARRACQQPRNPVSTELLRRAPRAAPPVPCTSDAAPRPCSG